MKAPAANAATRKSPILIPILVIIPLMGLGLYVSPNLLDSTAPTLTVNGLERDKRYSGSLVIDIAATDEKPGLGSLTVQIDDAPLAVLSFGEEDSTVWTLQTDAFPDGLHTVSVTATDRALHKNQTKYVLPFYRKRL